MSELQKQSFRWKEVLLVVLGSALAIPTVLISGIVTQSNDQQAFLRQQRLAVYEDFLSAMSRADSEFENIVIANSVDEEGNLPSPTADESEYPAHLVDEVAAAFDRVQIIGSREAVDAAGHALEIYRSYGDFLEERLLDLAEYDGGTFESATDWLYDGGADFVRVATECLSVEGRGLFVASVQADLGIPTTSTGRVDLVQGADVCKQISWSELYSDYVDALAAGSFG
ncbi:hypothetical protein [Microbacterium maritypicum]